MANSLSLITNLTVFGNKALSALSSKLVMFPRVTRGVPVGSTAGNTIQIADLDVAGDAAIRAVGGAATASDLIAGTRTLTKQQIYKAVTVENLDMMFSSVPIMERVADRLVYKVAKKFDALILGLWNQIPYTVGKLDASAVWNSTDVLKPLNDARKKLGQNEADTDGLVAVFNPTESANFRNLSNLFKVNEAGSDALLRQGLMGSILGFDIIESQQVPNATLNVAAESASPAAVVGAHVLGATTLSLNGLGTGTLKKGATLTIAGELNGTGNAVGHVVTADATITANAASPVIYPPLTMALAGSEAVTLPEYTNPPTSMNVAFHRDAIMATSFAPEPFPDGTGIASVSVSDPMTGLGIRVAAQSRLLGGAGSAYVTDVSADIVVAAGIVRPEFAVRITGQV